MTSADKSSPMCQGTYRLFPVHFFFMVAVLVSGPVFADESVSLELGAGLAYRQDYLQWSMAGPGHQPNIISELTWTNLDITLMRLHGALDWRRHWRLQGEYSSGRINNGESQDSDYSRDDRDGEFSRSNNITDGDGVMDAGGALAYIVEIPALPALQLSPRLGYSYRKQDLRMSKGNQTLSDEQNLPPDLAGGGLPALGPFAGLNSTYRARWFGPSVGLDVSMDLAPEARLRAGYTHHWMEYYGWANWNLISLFEHPKSYEQESTGSGNELRLAGELQLNGFSVYLQYDYGIWESEGGITRFFLADGNRVTQPFNGATWRTYALTLGVTMALYP